jgi:SET domain-containing protein
MKESARRRKPLLEVRHSRIHGYGVFALRRIRKGTMVIEYLGDRVSHDEANDRYADKDPKDGHTFLFTVDARTVIDAGVAGNEARFINHGCDPNCQTVNTNRRIFIEALHTIQPGEELAYDYSIQRDDDDPPDVDVIFACRCGAQDCRGSMLEAPKRKRNAAKKSAKASAKRSAKASAKKAAKKKVSRAKPRGRRAAARRREAARKRAR